MISLDFPPGVTTLLSRSKQIRNWRDANLVRWDNGTTLRPIGGWEQVNYSTAFASRVRAMHRWVTQTGIVYTAYLCEQHCYIDSGGNLTDITPAGGMAALTGDTAGYGELAYNLSTYGTVRPGLSTMQKFSPVWTVNNWGEDLLVMTSYDGRLLRWKPSTPGTPLVAVPTAPVGNRQFVITPEHHCMLFQMGAVFAKFGWCDEEDLEDWNFADPVNKAGFLTVDPYSPIVAVQLTSAGIVIFTPAMSHIIEYIGLPFIYRIRPIGKVPIPISAASVSSVPDGVVWISVEGFWIFNGSSVNILPCPFWDVISASMDFSRTVREAAIVSLQNRGEIWWFWVDIDYGTRNSRYAAYDFRSNIWLPGFMSRTCGFSYANERNPVMSDGTKIWKHEVGLQYPEALFMPYLESQTLNSGNGAWMTTLNKILPDIRGDKTAIAFSLVKSNDRTTYSSQTISPRRGVNEHGWVDMRETAQDLRLRIEMINNRDWSTVGPIIFDFKTRGKKK
jgi:hypothetical protein